MSGSWVKRDRSCAEEPVSRRYSEAALAVAVALAALAVYLLTLAPTVATNDAGRFQIAAPLLGTGHPTGYPTFILLGKLFTFLPVGDVAYRVNLMSAVFGALAAALLFLVAREIGSHRLPAAGAALLVAFSATFWSQATFAEVYTMHAAFLLGVMLLMLRWRRTDRERCLLAAALLYGLSLGNNAGMALLAPAYLTLLLAGRRRLRLRSLAAAAGLGILGLSAYAYVPIRGFAGAWHNYGDPVRDWGDVWALISGARFRGLMDLSPETWAEGIRLFAGQIFSQAPQPLGAVVALLLLTGGLYGLWAAFRRDLAVGAAFALGTGSTLVYALSYRIDDIAVYYIPIYALLAVLLAAGASRLSRGPRALYPLVAVPLVVAALALYAGYPGQDRSDYYTERERSENVLGRLPENAVLYGKLPIVPITYLKEVEGRRRDVTLRWLEGKSLRQHFVPDIESGRPVYFISDPRYNEEYLEAVGPLARPVREDGLIRLIPNP